MSVPGQNYYQIGYWWKIVELCATQIFQGEHLKLNVVHRNVLVVTKICPLTKNLSEIEEHSAKDTQL